MKVTKPTFEQVIYLGIFVIGICLRFIKLDSLPLSDVEAANALQAFVASSNGSAVSSAHAGYLSLTTILFFMFGSSNWLARLVPAVTGSLLVVAPILFREKIGRIPALLVSFLLMFDPFLLPLSRQADGSIMAICGVIFALGFFLNRKMVLSGVCFGLALLGGPFFWYIFLIAGVVAIWDLLLTRRHMSADEDTVVENNRLFEIVNAKDWKSWGLGAGITVVLVCTVFFTMPGAASGLFAGFSSFIAGFGEQKPIELVRVFIGWLTYSPFLCLAGLVGVGWSIKNGERVDLYLRRYLFVAGLFILVYPDRSVVDLALISVVLSVFAARVIPAIVKFNVEDRWMVFAQTVLSVTLLVSAIFSYLALLQVVQGNAVSQTHIARLIAVVLLILLSLLLVGWGWSARTSLAGLFIGVLLISLVISFAAGVRSAGFGLDPSAELTRPGGIFTDYKLMFETIQDISKWKFGVPHDVSIEISSFDSPSLRWTFRNEKSVQFVNQLSIGDNPDMILTPSTDVVQAANNYVGQDFIINREPAWSLLLPAEWGRWAIFREVVAEQQLAILWVRSDLFPGAESTQSQNP